MTHVEDAIRHLDRRTRTTYEFRPTGPRPAQKKAEETWERRIDRLTELTGLPTDPLLMLFSVLLGIAIGLVAFAILALLP